jgi:hypothetical protein
MLLWLFISIALLQNKKSETPRNPKMCLKLRITSKISVTKSFCQKRCLLKRVNQKKKQPSDFPIAKDSQLKFVHDIKEKAMAIKIRQLFSSYATY